MTDLWFFLGFGAFEERSLMLIEFSVANFKSFKDRVTFGMEATPLTSSPEHKEVDRNNVFEINGLRLLKSSAI